MKPQVGSALIGVVLACFVATAAVSVTRRAAPCADATPARLLAWSQQSGPLHPRWAGCFDVAPAPEATASIVQARGELARFELAARTRSGAASENLGVALALAGEPGRGIDTIEGALDQQDDADTLANRSAARLLLSGQTGSAYALVQALDLSLQALERRPRHPAALYNKALALTALHLDELAQAAWRDYLAHDPSSAWATAARGQQEVIGRRMVSAPAAFMTRVADSNTPVETLVTACEAAPQACRQHLEDVLLARWGAAYTTGDVGAADASLSLARRLAAVLPRRGDRLDVDVVADIDRAVAGREPRATDLARACVAYAEGRAAIENEGNATPRLVEAEQLFAKAGNPMEAWAYANRVFTEFNTYDSTELDALQRVLEPRVAAAERLGYVVAYARMLHLWALTYSNRGHLTQAEPLLTRSIETFESTNEPGNQMSPSWLLSDTLMRRGDHESGWRQAIRMTALLPRMTSTRNRYIALLYCGTWMRTAGQYRAALFLLGSAQAAGVRARQRGWTAEAGLRMAQVDSELGHHDAAVVALRTAEPDPNPDNDWGGERARQEYLDGRVDVELQRDPSAAVRDASEALAFFQSRSYPSRVAALRLKRGRAFKALGDSDHAAIDFQAGIDTYESYRSELPTDAQRALSQDVWFDLYEEQVRLALGSPEMALEAAERSRARGLLELRRTPARKILNPMEMAGLLAPDDRLLYYTLLPEEVVGWVLSPSTFRMVRHRIARTDLERTAYAFVRALERGDSDDSINAQAERFFTLLVGPFAGDLPGHGRLFVVPDGALHRVPFAALRNPASGRRLMADYTLVMSPSASLIFDAVARPAATKPPDALLSIGDPALDDHGLPSLTGAASEARAIASLYRRPRLLEGADATKDAVTSLAAAAQVIHFGGHALATPGTPLLGYLRLAGAGPDASLDAEEIAELRLDGTEVVVLAACQTAAGAIRRGEGVMSLARPFLLAGAGAVIATLWDIDDALAESFVTALHRRISAGIDAADALAQTQREVAGKLPAKIWTAFTLVGGGRRGPSTT